MKRTLNQWLEEKYTLDSIVVLGSIPISLTVSLVIILFLKDALRFGIIPFGVSLNISLTFAIAWIWQHWRKLFSH